MRRISVLLLILWSTLAVAQPGGAAPPPEAPATATGVAPPVAPATATTEAGAAPALAISVRLDEAAFQALGPPEGSPCRAHQLPSPIQVGVCTGVGPYAGEIEGGQPGPEVPNHADALAACAQDPKCLGISSKWYVGSPWFAVTGGAFKVNPSSYGCTVLLKCPSDPAPKPTP